MQLLADVSGRCAAFFLKAQLYFLAREHAKLERRHRAGASSGAERVSSGPTHVVELLPPLPDRGRGAPRARRSRDYVA